MTAIGRSFDRPNLYPDYEPVYRKHSPLDRVGQSPEIANLVSFLVSDDAINMTGGIYVSDSGFLVKAAI